MSYLCAFAFFTSVTNSSNNSTYSRYYKRLANNTNNNSEMNNIPSTDTSKNTAIIVPTRTAPNATTNGDSIEGNNDSLLSSITNSHPLIHTTYSFFQTEFKFVHCFHRWATRATVRSFSFLPEAHPFSHFLFILFRFYQLIFQKRIHFKRLILAQQIVYKRRLLQLCLNSLRR